MSAINPGPISGSLERLRQEVDRIVENAWSQGERAADFIGLKRNSSPPVEVVEHSERILVAIDLPGVPPDAIDLSIVGNMLTVQGTFPPSSHEGGQVHHCERSRGAFKRSIPLPASVNPDDVLAESRHGVLHVSIGKVDAAKARRIPVTGTSAL